MEAHEPHRHEENIQTQLAKAERISTQQEYSCHETTVVMIVSLCIFNIVQKNTEN